MARNADGAKRMERLLRAELPATRGTLDRVFQRLSSAAVDTIEDPGAHLSDLDATLLVALAEDSLDDAELRHELENLLGRTLWGFTHSSQLVQHIADVLVQRARAVRKLIPNPAHRAAFFRTGLSLQSCLTLSEGVAIVSRELVTSDADLLSEFIRICAPIVELSREVKKARIQTSEQLADIAHMWLQGADETDLESSCRELGIDWFTLRSRVFDGVLPWCLTAVVEIATVDWNLSDAEKRELLERLMPARVRYGVPNKRACSLVRHGISRSRAVELSDSYLASDSQSWLEHLDRCTTGPERERLRAMLVRAEELWAEGPSVA